ncbi:uncharacterized protein LOC105191239 [Harpegnathos saltator]|uniref:uncharacterized protein LOC105191239 n=1 Tax=Harpegnathos saltator TaxID=610380 RepID=UPI000DBED2CB|nr:uncharacterized protein LOC105191239 [Harpegnathos saltator]
MRAFALRRSWRTSDHLTTPSGGIRLDPTSPVSHRRVPPTHTHTHTPVSTDMCLSVPCPCVSWYKSNCVSTRTSSIVQKVGIVGIAYSSVERSVEVSPVDHRDFPSDRARSRCLPEEASTGKSRVWSKVAGRCAARNSRKRTRATMAGCLSFVLVAIASTIAMAESRVIPAEPISVMLDAYGNPIMFLREKRTAVHPYPQRAMMFTGYYRPVRRSNNNGGQATGVFAQGNAVSGEAFFSGMHTPHLGGGPEPIEESEVSSAEAQAAPASDEVYNDEERHQEQQPPPQEHHPYHQEHHHHHHQQEEHHREHHRHDEEEQHHRDEHHHRHQQDSLNPQEHHEPEQIPSTTDIAQPAEGPIAASTEVSVTRPKVHNTKKTQKTPVIVDNDDDDDDDDEADEQDDGPAAPFVPFKGNRRRQGYPNLNNFFPMVFSFPRVATRAGSAGSPPGAITAIANSYSTGKGGVASSVATAYGGSPAGKKRRSQPSEE